MNIRSFKFNVNDIKVDPLGIEKFMGYVPGEAPDPFPQLINEVLEEVPGYCDIQGGYRIFDRLGLEKKTYQLNLENQTFNIKRIITHQLRKAEMAALFICTAGAGIGEWSKKLMREGDLMKGYVVDVIGSELVEGAMDKVQDELENEMRLKDLGITDRYSPGYCDWQVSEQPKLFSLFPENFCGVRLSASCLMYPIKSVSGIIGIGRKAERKGYICSFCDMKNCIYRNKRYEISC
ncbi:MAG: hypothetical protein KFF73_11765 [Cyclobacteriaceae bacterium]|nr:hypothetical protein [Cyclobacteriaceae bacterium]